MDAVAGTGAIDWPQAVQGSSRRIIRHRYDPLDRPPEGLGRAWDLTPDDLTTTGGLEGLQAHRLGTFPGTGGHGPLALGAEAPGRPTPRRGIPTGLGDGGAAIVSRAGSGARAQGGLRVPRRRGVIPRAGRRGRGRSPTGPSC